MARNVLDFGASWEPGESQGVCYMRKADMADFRPIWYLPNKADAVAQVKIDGVSYLCVEPRGMPRG
jgi:hypothetical protein